MLHTFLVLLCSALVAGFTAKPVPAGARAVRSSSAQMMGKAAPDGAFGGAKKPGAPGGWIGDQSKGYQVKRFEEGTDYLFFQGPAPKTAVQDDMPSFFSGDNFADMEITTPQVVITGVGVATAVALAGLLVTG